MAAKKTLFLVRHGQYTSTAQPDDEPDGPLTELGREQVALLAQRLKEFSVRKIYHSPLIRAAETASLLSAEFPGVALEASPILVECIPAVPSDLAILPEVVQKWFAEIPAEFIEKGGPQARQVFETYFQPPEGDEDYAEIIVSHGNLIAYLVCQVLKAPAEAWNNTDIQNSGLSEISIRSSGYMRLNYHNDTSHLPNDKKTWT